MAHVSLGRIFGSISVRLLLALEHAQISRDLSRRVMSTQPPKYRRQTGPHQMLD